MCNGCSLALITAETSLKKINETYRNAIPSLRSYRYVSTRYLSETFFWLRYTIIDQYAIDQCFTLISYKSSAKEYRRPGKP